MVARQEGENARMPRISSACARMEPEVKYQDCRKGDLFCETIWQGRFLVLKFKTELRLDAPSPFETFSYSRDT
jgi:hypothetical protein